MVYYLVLGVSFYKPKIDGSVAVQDSAARITGTKLERWEFVTRVEGSATVP